MNKERRLPTLKFFLLGIALFVFFFADVIVGSISIPLTEITNAFFDSSNATWHTIVWQFRLPRAAMCVLAGASLSCSGLLMQTLFRNPLAGPDVLGLSSGASLAVGIVVLLGKNLQLTNAWSLALAAGSGSIAVLSIMLLIARTVRDNASLLIIGLMIAATTSSLISIFQFVSKAEDLQFYVLWTMGSVGNSSWNEIDAMMIIFCACALISFFLIKSLNGWLLGENYAKSLGINTQSRMLIVTVAGLMTGAVTAFCGPIAFVGLAVPHLARLMMQTNNHKFLLPAVMVGGAVLLLFCDLTTQWISDVQSIPLNAVTSIIGAPIVIWQVMKLKKITV